MQKGFSLLGSPGCTASWQSSTAKKNVDENVSLELTNAFKGSCRCIPLLVIVKEGVSKFSERITVRDLANAEGDCAMNPLSWPQPGSSQANMEWSSDFFII